MKYVFGLALFFGYSAFAQNEVRMVKRTVDIELAREQIEYLASDELQGRDVGTKGIELAANYLVEQLESYGIKPAAENGTSFRQAVSFLRIKPADKAALILDQESFQLNQKLAIIEGTSGSFEGEVVDIGYGSEADFSSKDLEGKILLIKAGSHDNQEEKILYRAARAKLERAKNAGAKGVIEYHDFPDDYWKNVVRFLQQPSFQLADEDKNKIKEPEGFFYLWVNDTDLSSTSNSFTLKIEGLERKKIQENNIVGILEGTDPGLKEEFIIYMAHYDHVGVGIPNQEGDSIYNGARDNAVGVTAVLQAADNFGRYPSQRSAIFLFVTAEEKGLLGAKFYVNHPVVPHEKVVFVLNSDNGGYNNTSIVTIPGLERTTAGEIFEKAADEFDLKAVADPPPGFFNRSDNILFAQVGIPAPTFSLGFDAFDEEITKYYHRPEDEASSLDYDYLLKFFRSYVLACRRLANAELAPFWVEGDPFYEAGIELYGR